MTPSGDAILSATLLTGVTAYTPERTEDIDVLIVGDVIQALGRNLDRKLGPVPLRVLELSDMLVFPGFVDNHCHILGGGGATGYSSRVPELQLSQFTRAGITTVVGMLGFDASSRHPSTLLARARALKEEGLSTYVLTGATPQHPVPTLTGSVASDIALVEEVIGVGELSISELGYGFDSYGSGAQYVAEVASEAWLAGRLNGKAGKLCLQVPPHAHDCMASVFDIVTRTGIPISQFLPSHVNQSDAYLDQAVRWAARGGAVDIGANYSSKNGFRAAIDPEDAVQHLLTEGVTADHIMLSTDGGGAIRKADEGGPERGSQFMSPASLLNAFVALATNEEVPLNLLPVMFSESPARFHGLQYKGQIKAGNDADLLVFDDAFQLQDVFARGEQMVSRGRPVKRGRYEHLILKELA